MTTAHPRKIIIGTAATALCFAGALLLPMFVDQLGGGIPRMIILLGIIAVAIPTFEWGAILGYRVQDEDGRLLLGHVVRCAVMTAIMVGIALLIGSMITGIALANLK
jgi:hypothetical protein